MTDNIENLILEHRRAIRADVGQIKDYLATAKQRLTSVETQIAHLHGDNAFVYAPKSRFPRGRRARSRIDSIIFCISARIFVVAVVNEGFPLLFAYVAYP